MAIQQGTTSNILHGAQTLKPGLYDRYEQIKDKMQFQISLFLTGCVLEMVVAISAHTLQVERILAKYHTITLYTQVTILSALFQSKYPNTTIV